MTFTRTVLELSLAHKNNENNNNTPDKKKRKPVREERTETTPSQ